MLTIVIDSVLEYRDKTKYWDKRILNRDYEYIRFSNGYGNDTRPYLITEYQGYTIDDNASRYCFIIKNTTSDKKNTINNVH